MRGVQDHLFFRRDIPEGEPDLPAGIAQVGELDENPVGRFLVPAQPVIQLVEGGSVFFRDWQIGRNEVAKGLDILVDLGQGEGGAKTGEQGSSHETPF